MSNIFDNNTCPELAHCLSQTFTELCSGTTRLAPPAKNPKNSLRRLLRSAGNCLNDFSGTHRTRVYQAKLRNGAARPSTPMATLNMERPRSGRWGWAQGRDGGGNGFGSFPHSSLTSFARSSSPLPWPQQMPRPAPFRRLAHATRPCPGLGSAGEAPIAEQVC